MKKRSLLRTILCSILLFGTIVPSFAADQTAAVSPEVKETAKPKGSAYSRFANWLRARTRVTRSDIRHLWRWGSKKVRGQQVSERESAAAKRIAKKIGISLAVIAGFFLFKSKYDWQQYLAAKKRVDKIPRLGRYVWRNADIVEAMVSQVEKNNIAGVRDVLGVAAYESNTQDSIRKYRLLAASYEGLNRAIKKANLEMVKVILPWFPRFSIKQKGGWFNLEDLVISTKNVEPTVKREILELLLQKGASVDVWVDKSQIKTFLYDAVEKDQKEIAELLLSYGARSYSTTHELDILKLLKRKAQDDADWKSIYDLVIP